jgi:hypothetical protein
VEDFFRAKVRIDVANRHINSVTKLGKRKETSPVLFRFIPYSKEYEILLNFRTGRIGNQDRTGLFRKRHGKYGRN